MGSSSTDGVNVGMCTSWFGRGKMHIAVVTGHAGVHTIRKSPQPPSSRASGCSTVRTYDRVIVMIVAADGGVMGFSVVLLPI